MISEPALLDQNAPPNMPLPPLRVYIHNERGELVRIENFPDPREKFLRDYGGGAREYGYTATLG